MNTVSNNVEVILDGQRILLEKGDKISINEMVDAVDQGAGQGETTPSQLFSQALLHGFDLTSDVVTAIGEVRRVGRELNLPPDVVEASMAYTVAKYKYYEHNA